VAVGGGGEDSAGAAGGLAEDVAGDPPGDPADVAGEDTEGVLTGGFDAATGANEGRFTGKSFSSNKSPLPVKIKTVASRYISGDFGKLDLNRIVLKWFIPKE